MFGSRQPARVVFTGEQPPLAVSAISVAVVRGAAEYGDFSGFLKPSQNTVVGDVTEEEVSSIPNPKGTLCPACTCKQSLYRRALDLILRKTRVNDLHSRIGIGDGTFRFLCTGKSNWLQNGSHCCASRHVDECASLHRSLLRRRIRCGPPYHGLVCCRNRNLNVLSSSRVVAKVTEGPSNSNIWFGLDRTDAPLILRDVGTDEIYALTLEREWRGPKSS